MYFKKQLTLAFFLAIATQASAQADSLRVDTTQIKFLDFILPHWWRLDIPDLDHQTDSSDTAFQMAHNALKDSQPTSINFEQYFQLAEVLFRQKQFASAKKMFTTILASQKNFYTQQYFHGSDVPGDTTTNSYGYGSYYSNYKHFSSLHLAEICIIHKQYTRALSFLKKATTDYAMHYNCGTGENWHRYEIDKLYALAYEGLNDYKHAFSLLMPTCMDDNNGVLVRMLLRRYKLAQIRRGLRLATKGLRFRASPEACVEYTGEEPEHPATMKSYYPGSAQMELFGYKIKLPVANWLENKQHMTRAKYQQAFRESSFYKALWDGELPQF
jgi:tetratricopeptide (TPR) repeat protein